MLEKTVKRMQMARILLLRGAQLYHFKIVCSSPAAFQSSMSRRPVDAALGHSPAMFDSHPHGFTDLASVLKLHLPRLTVAAASVDTFMQTPIEHASQPRCRDEEEDRSDHHGNTFYRFIGSACCKIPNPLSNHCDRWTLDFLS